MKVLQFDDNELADLKVLANWMDIFGFFYYVASGMYGLGALFLLTFSFIARGSNIFLLAGLSLVMAGYCFFSISAGRSLFKSSDNFLKILRGESDNKASLIDAFSHLRQFFWFYGALISLSIVFLFFVF